MNALNLYDIEDLRFESTASPEVKAADDIVIRVKIAGICGSDLSRYRKLGPYVKGMTWGHEFSGVVEAVGENVTHVKPGNRVAACPTIACGICNSCLKGFPSQCNHLSVIGAKQPGGFAEFTKLPARNVLPIPDSISMDHASLVEPSAVAAHGLYLTSLQPGGTVAVLGCGNIGLLSIAWAKLFGASAIYAIDIDPKKLELAKQMGADVIINPLEVAAHEQLSSLTEGDGVDVAVESAGSPLTSAQVFALPRKGGEVVFMGIPYGDVSIERFYFEKIVRNELKVYGSWNAVSSPFPGKEWTTTIQKMSTGELNVAPMITHRLPLREGPQAFHDIIHQKDFYGKVLLDPTQ
ncbi:galactitol-1-phosphate 5-dehydrogenase [Alkalicoccobacillus porphyridii]|uniref:Galactitol-1-phosphate 5-dehydrogenase n=1 Tax=Alkalicoccobacillus porphyridii TaxID=2597270 RepID=A0A554A1N1_9BACI|nr:galactitol-1-phosphate 5-dehydrogenase [Alkalicoccobacillus porphyridii]TSB47585.1 galactitol-1-phosphate 5-dehydrogenase [Alkalicoccobacillus porphyridii]